MLECFEEEHRTKQNRHPANKVPVCVFGGPCRIRTYDQRIKSPLLYQLS